MCAGSCTLIDFMTEILSSYLLYPYWDRNHFDCGADWRQTTVFIQIDRLFSSRRIVVVGNASVDSEIW